MSNEDTESVECEYLLPLLILVVMLILWHFKRVKKGNGNL
jgi:hypothetical protein